MLIHGRLLIDPAAPAEPGWLRIEDGRIAELHRGDPPAGAGPPDYGGRDRIICPAFLDAHMHFPQIDSGGCDGLHLLEWLDRIIFPAESWWGRGAAGAMARTAVRRLVREGTCGVAGYLSSHGDVSRSVLDWLETSTPLRCIAGRVAMDRFAPDDLTAEDRQRAAGRPPRSPVLPSTSRSPRHRVSANPRFAVACSDELLAEFGWFAREHPGVDIQTHLAESKAECELVAELFPDEPSYTAVYDRFGLLTDRTLLAHCIHTSEAEWRLIAERESVVVHCPTANIFLEAGLFDFDAARRHGVRLALGSDVAAGFDIAMPRIARAMIETAKVRRLLDAGGLHVPTPAEAWSLITSGNADALGWPDAGRLEVGAAADLLVLGVPASWVDDHLVGRLLYNWDHTLIEKRIFDGRPVDPSEF